MLKVIERNGLDLRLPLAVPELSIVPLYLFYHVEFLLVLNQSHSISPKEGRDRVSGLAGWGDDFISDRQVPDQ